MNQSGMGASGLMRPHVRPEDSIFDLTAVLRPHTFHPLSSGLGLAWGLLRPHEVLSRTYEDICEDFLLTSKIQCVYCNFYGASWWGLTITSLFRRLFSQPLVKKIIIKVLLRNLERLMELMKTLLRRLCKCNAPPPPHQNHQSPHEASPWGFLILPLMKKIDF